VFGNLGDGTPPVGEKVIEVWAEPKCACDDCDCHDDEAAQIRLELDGEPVGEPCPSSQCEFVVVLTAGTHAITAIATYDTGELSSSVQIEVPSAGGTTETGSPPADDVDDDSEGGCGCTHAQGSAGLAVSMAFVLFGLFAGARRWRR